MTNQNGNVVDLLSSSQQLNRQFHAFLSIDDEMLTLVQRYRSVLLDAISDYPDVSHNTLLKFEPSAEGLTQYQQAREDPQVIAERQTSYLKALLDDDENSAPLLTHAGAQYYSQRIKPLWILASYYQYLDQLTTLIADCPDIEEEDRPALSTALSKLVLSDMGLMLQGHWNTATHSALADMETLSTVDTLTQLANRTLWHDRLKQAITAARRSGEHRSVLMIVDLNHFKIINDTLGHPIGDTILRETAQRLKAALREADTLARLGGDEFGVLLPNHQAPWEAARSVAKKILNCFERPFGDEKEELFISAAIGIAIYPDDGESVSNLVSHAEIAMYRAKREGIGYRFYQASADEQQIAQLQLSNQLHHALENQELELHYQPKIDLHNTCLCGTEALLRWRHPKLGLLTPDHFIALAEQIGLIGPITEWVLITALQQQRDWQDMGNEIPVSVNVSALSFQNPELLEMIDNAIQQSGIRPHNLEIEITENTLLTGMDHCSKTVDALSRLGVRIAIDDFGTGYSSLSYLRQLPIDTLKIDKSFVQNMKNSHSDAVIVRSIIELGHNLGYTVVAEGVETDKTCKTLHYLRCDIAQGYFIGTPMSNTELGNWLNKTSWAEGWQ